MIGAFRTVGILQKIERAHGQKRTWLSRAHGKATDSLKCESLRYPASSVSQKNCEYYHCLVTAACSYLTVGELLDTPDMNLLLPFTGLGNIIRSLHPHERIHIDAEGFFNS